MKPYTPPFNPGPCPPRKALPVFVVMEGGGTATLKGCGSPQPEASGTMAPTSDQVSPEGSCVSPLRSGLPEAAWLLPQIRAPRVGPCQSLPPLTCNQPHPLHFCTHTHTQTSHTNLTPFSTRTDTCLTQLAQPHPAPAHSLLAKWWQTLLLLSGPLVHPSLQAVRYHLKSLILSGHSTLKNLQAPYCLAHGAIIHFCQHSPSSTLQSGLPPLGLSTPYSFQPPHICLPNINFSLSLPKQMFPLFQGLPPSPNPPRSFP